MEYKLYEKFKTPNEYISIDEKIRPIYNIFRQKIYLDNGVSNVTSFCVDFEKLMADPIGKPLIESAVYTDASANLYFRQHRGNWNAFTDFVKKSDAVMISAPGSRYIAVIMQSKEIESRKTVVIWLKDMENDTMFEYHNPSHA